MNITELIEKLSKVIATHGNLEVMLDDEVENVSAGLSVGNVEIDHVLDEEVVVIRS